MKGITATAAAIGAAAVLTACSASHPSTAASPPAPVTSAAAASPSPRPVSTARLTKKQAARAYARIVNRGNALTDDLNREYTDDEPWSQIEATSAAYVKEMRAEIRELRAVRWPRNVEPYITAMTLTDFPAAIRCTKAQMAAGAVAAANTVLNTNEDCVAQANETDPGIIRGRLGLPPPE